MRDHIDNEWHSDGRGSMKYTIIILYIFHVVMVSEDIGGLGGAGTALMICQ